MQNPANLRVYGIAKNVVIETYAVTARLPLKERYALSAQMRRAAISIGSNIAEGCGRQGNRALTAALHHALGSASELLFQAEVAVALDYCSAADVESLLTNVRDCMRMLSRLIARLRWRGDQGARDATREQ